MRLKDVLRSYANIHRGACPGRNAIAAYVSRSERYDEIAEHISCCKSCCELILLEIDWQKLGSGL